MSGITRENLEQAIRLLEEEHLHRKGELHYFTGGTGVPDELAVEYFADCGVYVHTRDGKTWRRGVCVSPAEEIRRLYGVRVVKANPVVLNREMRRLRQRRKEK